MLLYNHWENALSQPGTMHSTSVTLTLCRQPVFGDLGATTDGSLLHDDTCKKKQATSCFNPLRQMRIVRRSLTKEAIEMLESSFIRSRIDYCNAVFAGLSRPTTTHLDSVLHAAARMIILPLQIRPHNRCTLGRAALAAGATTGATQALSNDLRSYQRCCASRPCTSLHQRIRQVYTYRLRSADFDQRMKSTPVMNTDFKKRAFANAGPHVCNTCDFFFKEVYRVKLNSIIYFRENDDGIGRKEMIDSKVLPIYMARYNLWSTFSNDMKLISLICDRTRRAFKSRQQNNTQTLHIEQK